MMHGANMKVTRVTVILKFLLFHRPAKWRLATQGTVLYLSHILGYDKAKTFNYYWHI